MRKLLFILVAMLFLASLSAQRPMYVVNGTVVDSIEHIPHEDIENIEVLPADEQTIRQWGEGAGEGVIIVTLRYDTAAHFNAPPYDNFTDYLAHTVKWSERMPAERVSLRIRVDASGHAEVETVLQATSRALLKRVTKAIANAPLWSPAIRQDRAVESLHLVNIQLPEGKQMETERSIILL